MDFTAAAFVFDGPENLLSEDARPDDDRGLPSVGPIKSGRWKRFNDHRSRQWSTAISALGYAIQHAVGMTSEALRV